jgi:hypothetical protein
MPIGSVPSEAELRVADVMDELSHRPRARRGLSGSG